MSTRASQPGRLENLLLKPYFWQRPTQLLRRVALTLTVPPDPSIVALPWGLTIECRPREMVGSSITRTGVFEIATTEVLMRLADRGELALDVGANIGYMTSVLAHSVGPTGRVMAFEPNPDLYPTLTRNVARWRRAIPADITTSRQAISDKAGTGKLTLPAATDSNQSTATLSANASPSTNTVMVETVALDDLLPDDRVGVLKLDVEGHEPAVLRGARRLMGEGRIRDIVFEDHGSYPTATTAAAEENGYAVFTLVERPLRVRLLPRGEGEADASWNAPMRLATLAPVRAHDRLRLRGWVCFATRRVM